MSTATSPPSPATAEADAERVPARRPLLIDGVQASAAPPVQIFQGYDSVIGAGRSTAIKGTTRTVEAVSDGDYQGCETIEALSRQLRVNQSLSVGFGPFGGASQKMSFIYKLDVTTTSLSLVAYARHVTGKRVATNSELERTVRPPVGNEELKRFFMSYGDSFLNSITEGGEYYGVYTFYTQTKTEQVELRRRMEAAGIWHAGLGASLQLKLDEFVKNTTTRWDFQESVSGIANPTKPGRNHFIEYAERFSEKPLDAPVIIDFDAEGYEHVPGIDDFQPIVRNRTYFIGFLRDDAGLTKDLVKLQQLSNQADWINSVYRFYPSNYTDEELNRVAALANADIDAIDDQIEAFEADPTQTFRRPNLQGLDFGTPVLQYNWNSQGWGGTGGTPFPDVDPTSAVQTKTWLSALQLYTSTVVDRLVAVYKDENDKVGRIESHGSSTRSPTAELKFLDGEFVQSVSGRADRLVDRLDVKTNKGHQCAGGGTGGKPFYSEVGKAPDGKGMVFALGFNGRADKKLDRIEVVWAWFEPVTWTPF